MRDLDLATLVWLMGLYELWYQIGHELCIGFDYSKDKLQTNTLIGLSEQAIKPRICMKLVDLNSIAIKIASLAILNHTWAKKRIAQDI